MSRILYRQTRVSAESRQQLETDRVPLSQHREWLNGLNELSALVGCLQSMGVTQVYARCFWRVPEWNSQDLEASLLLAPPEPYFSGSFCVVTTREHARLGWSGEYTGLIHQLQNQQLSVSCNLYIYYGFD